MRVLLVSSSLVGADQLAEAAAPGVITVVFDGSTDAPAEILSLIESALAGQKADSIAFAGHELGDGRFYLTGDCSVDLAGLATDGQLQAFWQGIGSLLSEHGRVDLMVCNPASTAAGNGLISQLETIIGRDVAASSDPTGNADSGGDWILEDGNVDVAAAYFDSAALSQYQGILADSAPVLSLNSGAGALDLTFAGDGSLLTDFGVSSDYAYAAVIQSDSKIVVAGYAWNGSNYDIAVVRYNSDGTLDTTFGTGGKVTTGWGHNEYAYSVAIQADGKIVVAGTDSHDFGIVRYDASHLAYTENDGPRVIDGTITVTDVDSANMESATIQITGNYHGNEDRLSINASDLAAGVTATWDAKTGTLTLKGLASTAEYETMLEHVRYTNNSDAPNAGNRTITWTVNDGSADSPGQETTITVTALNDAPELTVPGAQDMDKGSTLIISGISVSDPDVKSGTGILEVTLDVESGTIMLSSLAGIAFASGDANGTGHMTFAGTLANINAALNNLQFTPLSGFSGNTVLTISVNDKGTSARAGYRFVSPEPSTLLSRISPRTTVVESRSFTILSAVRAFRKGQRGDCWPHRPTS